LITTVFAGKIIVWAATPVVAFGSVVVQAVATEAAVQSRIGAVFPAVTSELAAVADCVQGSVVP
jgi:hypothetical protein